MIDGLNRFIFLLLGLALLAAGILGLLAYSGQLPILEPSQIYEQASATVATQPVLWWLVILAAAVLVVVLGIVWLGNQVNRRPRMGLSGDVLISRGEFGTTRVRATALADALEADLRRITGVTDARVRLTATHPQPVARVRLDVDANAAVADLRGEAEDAFERIAATLEADQVLVDLRVRLSDRQPSRVR